MGKKEGSDELLLVALVVVVAVVVKNVRPSADDLPEELAAVMTSCWKEDPEARPNFSQIVQMLLSFLAAMSPPAAAAGPVRVFTSENAVLPPESPGTSSLMAVRDGAAAEGSGDRRSRGGIFFCFSHCY